MTKKDLFDEVLREIDWENDLQYIEGDWDDPSTSHIDLSGSTSGEIYYPPLNEWPAIINSTNHTLSIQEISHTDTSIEWQCLVRTADTVWSENFSISRPLPLPVVRCFIPTIPEDSPLQELNTRPGSINTAEGSNSLGILDNLDTLVDELCFVTIQILEGRYKGPHRRNVVSEGGERVTSTDNDSEDRS